MTPAILPPLIALAAGCLAVRVLWQDLIAARHTVPRLMAALRLLWRWLCAREWACCAHGDPLCCAQALCSRCETDKGDD